MGRLQFEAHTAPCCPACREFHSNSWMGFREDLLRFSVSLTITLVCVDLDQAGPWRKCHAQIIACCKCACHCGCSRRPHGMCKDEDGFRLSSLSSPLLIFEALHGPSCSFLEGFNQGFWSIALFRSPLPPSPFRLLPPPPFRPRASPTLLSVASAASSLSTASCSSRPAPWQVSYATRD